VTIQQSFVPRWDGLREIELILVRHGEQQEGEDGRFHLQLFDDTDTLVGDQELAASSLSHNLTYTFRFEPQPGSAGRTYRLRLSGSEENPISVWGYSLDVYGRGELVLDGGPLATAVPTTNARELRFVTRTQLTWENALQALFDMVWYEGLILVLALFFLPLPGVLLLLLTGGFNRKGREDRQDAFFSFGPLRTLRFKNPLAWWGIALALGTAVWPLLWFGMTLAGGHWRGWSLWLLFVVGWAAVLLIWWKRKRRRGAGEQRRIPPAPQHPHTPALILILLLALTLATRFLAVRDLSFPPWVDASRHGLITAVMAESGQIPGSYAPYLPVENPPYHYGFHTLSASLSLMTGWPLNRLLLSLGQLIGGLVPLTVYTAVYLMTRRQRAGLLGAFLVGLPFFFPGYYATWGRLTQLTAMFIMPVLLALTWLLVRGGRDWRRDWWLVGLLAAGLFLIHLRVFLYFLPFAGIIWMMSFGRNGRWLAAASGLALLLVSPRIWQLAAVTEPSKLISNPIPNYNAFPTNYVQTGWEQQFLWLAAVALIPLMVAGLRRQGWSRLPLFLTIWVAVLFIFLAGEGLGLPSSSLVNLNSMYITLFLPLSIFLAVAGDQLWRWLGRQQWLLQGLGSILTGALLTAALLFGIRHQIGILNPQTILAQHEDLAGMAWVEANLPETTVLGVGSWKWLGETWAASDGSAWIVPLTGHSVTTPPIDHVYNPDLFQEVRAFNETATAVTDWRDPVQADWLRGQGVTHIFIGKRGGYFDPAALAGNPKMTLLYGRNGVFVFKIRD
jgi:hypothetical protein